jgi:hypothetical protein
VSKRARARSSSNGRGNTTGGQAFDKLAILASTRP